MPKEQRLSLIEAMGATELSSTYLYLLLRTGKLRGEKDNNGQWWIPKSAVDELKAKRRAQ